MTDRGDKVKKNMGKIFIYFILILFVILFTFPFYYVFVLASQEGTNMYTNPPHIFFGTHYFENIGKLFEAIPFGLHFFNSVAIGVLATLSTAFFCTMGGFSLSKYEFKGKNFIYTLMITTIAIPTFLNLVPFFRMMTAFGWYDSWLPLIIPGMANAFGIFMMTQFLKQAIPADLLSAARIDGLSEYGILMKIVFPLAKSSMAILMIVTFVGSWNNLIGPLIFLPTVSKQPIPPALTRLFNTMDGDIGALMVGNTLTILPLAIVFSVFSKQIISGLTAGSIKG